MKTMLLIIVGIIVSISIVSILMNADQAFAFCDAHSEPCFQRIKTYDKIDEHFVRNYIFDYADDVFVHYDWPNKSVNVANNFDGFPAVYCFEIIADGEPHFLMTNWIDHKSISNIVDMYVPELCEQSLNPINSENRPDSLYVNKSMNTLTPEPDMLMLSTPPLHPDDLKSCLLGDFDDKNYKWCNNYKEKIKLLPPLKQFKSGVPIDDIQCKDNLHLIQKHDGALACVKPKSINALVFRGWTDDKFRTLPIIDFQNPDRIFREVGYLGLMMLLPHIENQTVAISLEGKPNMVLPIIQYYEIEILSEKTNTNESFSSVFGKITKPHLQKFFEENPMNLFVKRGVLLTSLGGYHDNTGTNGPFNQFLTDKESQIIGDALNYYENKRTNGENVHFNDFVKWPTGKINESFLQKSKLLDIASIEDNRITLNPTDTCAHISLRLLSADNLEQYQSRDKEIRFFEITKTDLEKLPVLDELIQATHHLEFTTNDDARAEMGLRELVDYEFFIMGKAIDKYDDSQDDYFVKLDGNLDEKLADPKPQGFSNEFLSPQLVYDDNAYVLSHTFFWVANEHETQHMSVHLQDSIDHDKKFITITEKDMESIPKIKQAIEKIGTEFESIVAYKGLPENPDWNEYREWFGQKKTEQFNLDETYVPGFVYNNEYYDLGFPIC
ncbi:hypothetical protein [Nitrosopumilus sp.]|uniref:hypothetical protein n=1 Tax=Nitrosopumilus sp. TaxID=2024843 RepID=UPI00247E282E|nr:hypothetical protein [Nitrosopumilus sp.]MCV0409619.1 hypothetical protein [Nitrosopumilus sp.]